MVLPWFAMVCHGLPRCPASFSSWQELALWPPKGVEIPLDDCAFEDTTAPLPLIAQRAYNDERRRDEALPTLRRKAATASFVTDFVADAGVAVPPLAESYQVMLEEFMRRVEEWNGQSTGREGMSKVF